MIMFALVWWCYPIVTACVAVPMAFFWFIETWRDAREAHEDGPYPCLAYLGRDVEVGELWCWLILGHGGEHEDQSELPETAFTREWPDKDHICFCGADHDSPGFSHDQMASDVTTPPGLSEFQETGGRALRPLPQRISKVPVQGSPAAPALCTWGEDGGGNDSACWKPEGHTGPHMVQDTSRYDD